MVVLAQVQSVEYFQSREPLKLMKTGPGWVWEGGLLVFNQFGYGDLIA